MSTASYSSGAWSTPIPGAAHERTSFDGDSFTDPLGTSPESASSLFAAMNVFGTSPDTPLQSFFPPLAAKAKPLPISAALIPTGPTTATTVPSATSTPPPAADEPSLLHMSLPTLLGCCEMLGHHMEDRSDIARQQDPELLREVQDGSAVELRDDSQRPLFVVAPLDVLVTRDAATGRNQFHIIEINGTGISGLTNMTDEAVEAALRSFSELAAHMTHQPDALILVASSGQETYPPVSRTLHEKMLYVEALKRGFEATGRRIHITNMTRLEKRPESMPVSGPTVVLGYMKQFRANFMLDGPTGRLMLFGRQVHAAINDRFVLNTCYQFDHQLDLNAFRGYNAGYAAGADKGVAYELYNQFFGSEELGAHFTCMAPAINFRRARTRTELISTIQAWLQCHVKPAVIKPQGTGCGHGIEFFFGSASWADTAAKVDRALHSVASNYNMQCGGLPYTVCEYLDTATIDAATPAITATTASNGAAVDAGGGGAASASATAAAGASRHGINKVGHKFELRIVVYRSGSELRAFPSIAKVAREAFDPLNPDNKKSLINNITTSAKETAQSGSEFLLPLCNANTLEMLDISRAELRQLCAATTSFMRYVVDQVQDCPGLFGLPATTAMTAVTATER